MSHSNHIETFPEEYRTLWLETERLLKIVLTWEDYLVHANDWIYVAILKRAAELVEAISQLLSLPNFPACTILDRALMELKFRASWLSEDNSSARLDEYASTIELECQVLIRKMKEGKSLSAQILNDLFGSSISETWQPNRTRRSSVFQLAEEADLAFDYDIPYWAESLYVHTHPLSMVMHRPATQSSNAPFADAIVEIASGKAIPFQLYGGVPSTFAWVLDYISIPFPHAVSKVEINDLRKLINETMNKATGGMWATNSDVQPGSLTIKSNEGKKVFKRRQRNG